MHVQYNIIEIYDYLIGAFWPYMHDLVVIQLSKTCMFASFAYVDGTEALHLGSPDNCFFQKKAIVNKIQSG